MDKAKGTSIWLNKGEYEALKRAKGLREEEQNRRIDFGEFLLYLLQEAKKQEDLVVVQKEETSLEKEIEEWKFPVTLDDEERERIAEQVVAKLKAQE